MYFNKILHKNKVFNNTIINTVITRQVHERREPLVYVNSFKFLTMSLFVINNNCIVFFYSR